MSNGCFESKSGSEWDKSSPSHIAIVADIDMATNPQDVAVKFDPVAAKLFAKGFNTLDESRNKFISVC